MGLITHAAAAGLGYAVGHPQGRQQLLRIRDQLSELLRRPQVVQVQERGRDLIAQKASAAVGAVNEKLRKSTATTPSGSQTTVPAAVADEQSHNDPPTQQAEDHRDGPDRPDAAPVGFGGASVEEDSQAVILGIDPLPRSTDIGPG